MKIKLAENQKCSCALKNENHAVVYVVKLKGELVKEKEKAKQLENELMENKKNLKMLNNGTKNLDQILCMGITEKTRFGLGYQGCISGSKTIFVQGNLSKFAEIREKLLVATKKTHHKLDGCNTQVKKTSPRVVGRDSTSSCLGYNRSSSNLKTCYVIWNKPKFCWNIHPSKESSKIIVYIRMLLLLKERNIKVYCYKFLDKMRWTLRKKCCVSHEH